MKREVIKKLYWDAEKEEIWLNSMSTMGMALIDYTWGRYLFEQAQPNEYIYRIELLEEHHNTTKSVGYIQFLEESGIECIAKHMRWVYLRKKASDGPFDIYSDMESRFGYYKRMLLFYRSLIMMELFTGGINLIIGIINGMAFNIIVSLPALCLAALLYKLQLPVENKIKKFQQEKILRE